MVVCRPFEIDRVAIFYSISLPEAAQFVLW